MGTETPFPRRAQGGYNGSLEPFGGQLNVMRFINLLLLTYLLSETKWYLHPLNAFFLGSCVPKMRLRPGLLLGPCWGSLQLVGRGLAAPSQKPNPTLGLDIRSQGPKPISLPRNLSVPTSCQVLDKFQTFCRWHVGNSQTCLKFAKKMYAYVGFLSKMEMMEFEQIGEPSHCMLSQIG